MRAKKGTVCTISAAVMAVVLAAGGCAVKSSMDQGTPAETVQETVVETEEMEYVEYVSDEDWDTMVHVYRIIMDNYDTAQGLVASGQADPSGLVDKAGELIEYGKACERDSLTAEEAGEKLEEMVNTADGMLDLIKRGGGTIVEIPVADETDAQEADVSGQDASEGAESAGEGGEDVGKAGGADSAENTEAQ